MATTVVFSGGPSPGEGVAEVLAAALGPGSAPPDRVIAADGGLGACLAAGLEPDVVVGDMDSVASADLSRAEVAGVRIERHPRDKDAVDLELALDAALRHAFAGLAEARPQPSHQVVERFLACLANVLVDERDAGDAAM